MAWFFDLLFGGGRVGSESYDDHARRHDKDKEHELPERIRKLPKDDPERMRFEKGWKERKKRDSSDAEISYSFSSSPLFASLGGLVMAGVIAFLGYTAYVAHQNYMAEIYSMRATIRSTVLRKGYEPYDPLVFSTVMRAENSNWLPTLEEILKEVSGMRPRLAVEWSAANPQSGSYLSYINKRNLPFDETEAMRWTVNEYRSR